MFDKLKKELDKLPPNMVVGLVVNAEHYEDLKIAMLKYLVTQKKQAGSYITVNKPFESVISSLHANKIKTDNLYFLDCITRKFGGKEDKNANCKFIDSPHNLTEISLEIHELLKANANHKFLFIDSLSTLAVYNNPEIMVKFVHYMTGKMRIWGLTGVFIALNEESDKKLISELTQFCDKIIRV